MKKSLQLQWKKSEILYYAWFEVRFVGRAQYYLSLQESQWSQNS